jgi:CheY-like chemotaxis protein
VARVLIVDRSAESREVLRTLLERGGVTAIEAGRPEQAVPLAHLHQPDLIVYDAESDRSEKGWAGEALEATATETDTPILILGRVSPPGGRIWGRQFVSKPYHYGPLIRKIESLLAAA